MDKQVSNAFGKKVYLLGADSEGIRYWLEEEKWDCDWYWGFGYIETYTTNEDPSMSRDINSHTHATDFLSKWFTEWNGSEPILKDTTFSNKEGWELSELFEQFYFLQEAAEMFNRGKAFVTNTEIDTWKDPDKVKEINEVILPKVMTRIKEILTPNN